VEQYLETVPPADEAGALEALRKRFAGLGKPVVDKGDIQRLEAIETKEAADRGLEEFKYSSNDEMLAAMGLAENVQK
jgi:hypothetical protein